MLAGIAEFERELIHDRTGARRERAKANGVKFGRKRKLKWLWRASIEYLVRNAAYEIPGSNRGQMSLVELNYIARSISQSRKAAAGIAQRIERKNQTYAEFGCNISKLPIDLSRVFGKIEQPFRHSM